MTGSTIPPKGSPERSAYFVALAHKSHAARPPRPTPVDGRRRSFPAGSDEEAAAEALAAEIGLERGADEDARSWRRRIYRLAKDDVALISTTSTAATDDPAVLIAHLRAEVTRYRERARRDRQIAEAHDRSAEAAETALAAALRRQAGTS